MPPKKGKKGGKKKGKKEPMDTSPLALQPYGCAPRDIIQTPLGVKATVLGVQKGDLWLQWPGDIKAPLPSRAKTKADMEAYGYIKQPPWLHIQRSIDERQTLLFQQRFYGGPGPKSAAMRLPMPKGYDTTPGLPEIAPAALPPRPKTAPR
uniref:Uncharacterized protein n=1 Tax=Chrysotila carterae TaxID=13221 RepID=A0A7S4FAM5_CHRCT|mmetsp:Transcript_55968/g.121831  ORF Transcript_55968/g.121831 Transcript_55968/m.121831 type:complete len:150 (+) Transcript_55968:332-781(+)|eukprot:4754497-Pleurochrysis_carterae.AAC.5